MRILRLLFLIVLLTPLTITAQLQGVAMTMLVSPIDPASVGRGESGVAGNDMLSAVSLNPAHLHKIEMWESFYDQQFFGSSASPDLNYFMAGGAYRLSPKDVIGASVRRFGFGEVINPLDGSGAGGSYEMSVALLYSRQFNKQFSGGVNFQLLRNRVAEVVSASDPGEVLSANTVAMDIGFLFQKLLPSATFTLDLPVNPELEGLQKSPGKTGIDFGLSLLNFGRRITYINESQRDPLPLVFRTGFSYHLLQSPLVSLDGNADMQKLLVSFENGRGESAFNALVNGWKGKTFRNSSYHFGLDATLFSIFLLQYGHIWSPGQPDEEFQHTHTIGLGVQTRYFSVHFGKWLDDAPLSVTVDNNYLIGITFGELEL